MTWTRLSDTFRDDPDLIRCSRDARLLHVEALTYCNQHLTDGVLTFGALARITDSPAANAAAAELCDAGLWTPLPSNAWQVDWSDQEPAAEVQARRANNAARQARFRDRQARHGAGDHSACTSSCPGRKTRPRNALHNGLVTPSPPDPSLSGGGGEDGAADAPRPPSPEDDWHTVEMYSQDFIVAALVEYFGWDETADEPIGWHSSQRGILDTIVIDPVPEDHPLYGLAELELIVGYDLDRGPREPQTITVLTETTCGHVVDEQVTYQWPKVAAAVLATLRAWDHAESDRTELAKGGDGTWSECPVWPTQAKVNA